MQHRAQEKYLLKTRCKVVVGKRRMLDVWMNFYTKIKTLKLEQPPVIGEHLVDFDGA